MTTQHNCLIFDLYAGANVTFANVVGTSMGFSRFLSLNSKMYSVIAGMFQGTGDIFGLIEQFYFDLFNLTVFE